MSSIEDILNADNDSDQEENAVGTGVDLDALLGSESDSDEDSMKVGAPVVVKAPTLSTTKHITAPIPTRIDYVEGRALKPRLEEVLSLIVILLYLLANLRMHLK